MLFVGSPKVSATLVASRLYMYLPVVPPIARVRSVGLRRTRNASDRIASAKRIAFPVRICMFFAFFVCLLVFIQCCSAMCAFVSYFSQ